MLKMTFKQRISRAQCIDIFDVLKALSGSSPPADTNIICPLPSHEESVGSARFYSDNNSWACFGCRNGGGPVDLVKKYLSFDIMKSIFWLERKFDLEKPSSKGAMTAKMKIIQDMRARTKSRFSGDFKLNPLSLSKTLVSQLETSLGELTTKASQEQRLHVVNLFEELCEEASSSAKICTTLDSWSYVEADLKNRLSSTVGAINCFVEEDCAASGVEREQKAGSLGRSA